MRPHDHRLVDFEASQRRPIAKFVIFKPCVCLYGGIALRSTGEAGPMGYVDRLKPQSEADTAYFRALAMMKVFCRRKSLASMVS